MGKIFAFISEAGIHSGLNRRMTFPSCCQWGGRGKQLRNENLRLDDSWEMDFQAHSTMDP